MYTDSEIFKIQLTVARMAAQLEADDRAAGGFQLVEFYTKRAWGLFRAAETIVSMANPTTRAAQPEPRPRERPKVIDLATATRDYPAYVCTTCGHHYVEHYGKSELCPVAYPVTTYAGR